MNKITKKFWEKKHYRKVYSRLLEPEFKYVSIRQLARDVDDKHNPSQIGKAFKIILIKEELPEKVMKQILDTYHVTDFNDFISFMNETMEKIPEEILNEINLTESKESQSNFIAGVLATIRNSGSSQ